MAEREAPSRRGGRTQEEQGVDQQRVIVASECSHPVLDQVDLSGEASTRRLGDAEETEARPPPIECVDRGEGLREGREIGGESGQVHIRSRHVRGIYPLHEQTWSAEEA